MGNNDDHDDREGRVNVDVVLPVGVRHHQGTDYHNDRAQRIGEHVEKDALHVHVFATRLLWHGAISMRLAVGDALVRLQLSAIAIAIADEGILGFVWFNDHYLLYRQLHVMPAAVAVPGVFWWRKRTVS